VKLITQLHLATEFKNTWIYTSTPPYVFMAWFLIRLSTGTTSPNALSLSGNHQVSDTSHVKLDGIEIVTAVTMKRRRETDVSEEYTASISRI
jgi:cell division septal protein FtsQ